MTSDTDILLLANNEYMKNIKEKLEKLNIAIDHFNLDNNSNDPI
jgi:ferredoxin-NADP reductase